MGEHWELGGELAQYGFNSANVDEDDYEFAGFASGGSSYIFRRDECGCDPAGYDSDFKTSEGRSIFEQDGSYLIDFERQWEEVLGSEIAKETGIYDTPTARDASENFVLEQGHVANLPTDEHFEALRAYAERIFFIFAIAHPGANEDEEEEHGW